MKRPTGLARLQWSDGAPHFRAAERERQALTRCAPRWRRLAVHSEVARSEDGLAGAERLGCTSSHIV
jgi:hypothetical protein